MNSSALWRPGAGGAEGFGDGMRTEVHWQKGLSNSRSGIAGQDWEVSAELFAEGAHRVPAYTLALSSQCN